MSGATALAVAEVSLGVQLCADWAGRQESTISRSYQHRRRRVWSWCPSGTSLGYTVHEVSDGHENPNGTLFTSDPQPSGQM